MNQICEWGRCDHFIKVSGMFCDAPPPLLMIPVLSDDFLSDDDCVVRNSDTTKVLWLITFALLCCKMQPLSGGSFRFLVGSFFVSGDIYVLWVSNLAECSYFLCTCPVGPVKTLAGLSLQADQGSLRGGGLRSTGAVCLMPPATKPITSVPPSSLSTVPCLKLTAPSASAFTVQLGRWQCLFVVWRRQRGMEAAVGRIVRGEHREAGYPLFKM